MDVLAALRVRHPGGVDGGVGQNGGGLDCAAHGLGYTALGAIFVPTVIPFMEDIKDIGLVELCAKSAAQAQKGFNLMRGGDHVPHPMSSPWDRPGFREKHAEAVKKSVSTSEARLKNSLRMKTLFSNPGERDRLSHQGKEISLRPGNRAAKREKWEDPAFSQKCSAGINIGAAREREKTHCPAGHEYSADNVYVGSKKYRGSVYRTRVCKTCHAMRARARHAISSRPKGVCACGSPMKRTSKRCPSCHHSHSFGKNEKVAWPSFDELMSLISSIGRSGVAKRFGVSFQAVTQKMKRHARHFGV